MLLAMTTQSTKIVSAFKAPCFEGVPTSLTFPTQTILTAVKISGESLDGTLGVNELVQIILCV